MSGEPRPPDPEATGGAMAGKQVMVIGLGQLGMAVVRSLSDADV